MMEHNSQSVGLTSDFQSRFSSVSLIFIGLSIPIHSYSTTNIPTAQPTFLRHNQHSYSTTNIPTAQPKFPQHNQHSYSTTNIPTAQPKFPQHNQHSYSTTNIPTAQPKFLQHNQHSYSTTNIPTAQPKFLQHNQNSYSTTNIPTAQSTFLQHNQNSYSTTKIPTAQPKFLQHNQHSYITTNKMQHLLSQIIYSCKTLYMFRAVFPSIIRSSELRIQQRYMSNSCCCSSKDKLRHCWNDISSMHLVQIGYICLISGYRHGLKIFPLLGCHMAMIRSYIWTFLENLSVPSRVSLVCLTLEEGTYKLSRNFRI